MINILDCTLRDGSYAIDYQFTAEDTTVLAYSLEKAGLRFIEIGHGIGLNASNAGKGVAVATDKEYLEAASKTLSKAKFGMFFIPGVGRMEDLDMAASYGMGFVRIGTDADRVHEAEEYIKHAKMLGMFVSSNLMKSYILHPIDLADKAKMAEEFGADVVVLVDSSGGMLPHDVRNYIQAMKRIVTKPIGFHGHNNLSMAVANSLEAVRNGATFVDSTLKGMGRSAGNAQTEILVPVLKKAGYDLDIDEFAVEDMAENLISPLMTKNQDYTAIVSGYADFHSSFLDTITKFAGKYSVDPRRLIVEVCKRTKTDLPEELAEQLAKELSSE
jgi:4-hydroxy 2-oxovalerate aldolase